MNPTEDPKETRPDAALQESNELLTRFIRLSPIYAFIKAVTPAESRVLYASENYRDMIGIPGSEMAGKSMEELFPPEFAAKFTADDWSVVAGGRVLNLDEDMNGRHFSTIKFPIVQGERTLLAGYTIDITERKRAEEALRDSESRLSRAESVARFGNWELSLDGLRLRASAGARAIYGLEGREWALAEVQGLTLPEHREPLNAALADLVERGRPYDREFRIRRAGDGLLRDIRSLAEYDPERRVVFGVIHDITDQKRAEADKALLEGQLRQAQKIESVGRLAGGVAHDFNNMLTVILGHVEQALELVDPALPLHAELEAVHQAARRSADLTRQLLAFARQQTVEPRVLDLNATVAGTLKMLKRLLGENIGLLWRPAPDLWPVRIDPSQVDQILANLCVNARDAIAGIGRITIATGTRALDAAHCARHPDRAPGEYAWLAVSDDGCGMDPETAALIFEPFFTTKATGAGTGLGLATVYGAVRQNGGFIEVESRPGAGSTFTIHLPRHAEPGGAARVDAAPGPADRGRETLLLVEDEPTLLRLTARMLEKLGYTVLSADTPQAAIRLAREHADAIRLLVTDVVMPEMNGRVLADRLRAIVPNLKPLFMSGYTADVIAHQGVVVEGVCFIQKPFSVLHLAAKVREALDRE